MADIRFDNKNLALHQRVVLTKWAALQRPKWENTYSVCPFCGGTTWHSGHTERPVLIVISGTQACDKCQEVRRLHPDIVAWIAKCFDWHFDDIG